MNKQDWRRIEVVKSYLDGLHDYHLYDADKDLIDERWDCLSKVEYITCSYLYRYHSDYLGFVGVANGEAIDNEREYWRETYGQDIVHKAGNILFPIHGQLYAREGNDVISGLQAYPCLDDEILSRLEYDYFTDNFWYDHTHTIKDMIGKRLRADVEYCTDTDAIIQKALQHDSIYVGEYINDSTLQSLVDSLDLDEIKTLFEYTLLED